MSPKFRFFVAAAILITSIVFFVRSCTRDETPDLPEGTQTITGVLTPVPLSLGRRGTHLLRVEDEDLAYVESTSINLRDFEHLDVTIVGIYEPNTDPAALPVLVASGVTLVEMQTKIWDIESLRLSVETPLQWEGEAFDRGMRFMQEGSLTPVLRVYEAETDVLPKGIEMQIDGKRAVLVNETDSTVAYVSDGDRIVAFSHSPLEEVDVEEGERMFLRILRSVEFQHRGSSSSRAKVGTGTGVDGANVSSSDAEGKPCGGLAGVLCSEGSYCEITDPENGIGRCRNLR